MSRSGAQPVSDANQPCEFLVVGLDIEFTYPKISASLDALMGGATFIACNRDKRFPIEGNRFLPGCGAMVAAIEAAWGKKPDYEVGKPDTTFLEIIAAETSCKWTKYWSWETVLKVTSPCPIGLARRLCSSWPTRLTNPLNLVQRICGLL
jgi:ribonucleotide monophosphatase NagD (HAD superfamily)